MKIKLSLIFKPNNPMCKYNSNFHSIYLKTSWKVAAKYFTWKIHFSKCKCIPTRYKMQVYKSALFVSCNKKFRKAKKIWTKRQKLKGKSRRLFFRQPLDARIDERSFPRRSEHVILKRINDSTVHFKCRVFFLTEWPVVAAYWGGSMIKWSPSPLSQPLSIRIIAAV